MQDQRIAPAFDDEGLTVSEKAAHVTRQPQCKFDDRHRCTLAAHHATLDRGVVLLSLHDTNALGEGRIDHRGEVSRIQNRVRLREALKYLQ